MNPLPLLGLALVAPQEPPDHDHVAILPVPRAVALSREDVDIRVDGTLLDWPDLPPAGLDHVLQLSGTPVYNESARAWRGPPDLSAKAFLLWDEVHFYFACVVMDDWHRPLNENHPGLDEVPPVDSVVVSFDPRRDTRALGQDAGRDEDREYWLADMDVKENNRRVVQWDRYRSTAGFANGAVLAVGRDPERGLTTYEFRIPWQEILPGGMKPEAGMVFDMQIVVNDYDEVTDPMAQTRAGWTFGSSPIVDPGLFGSVMLVDDFDASTGRLPEIDPPAEIAGDPVPGPDYWSAFHRKLDRVPAAIFDGKGNPQEAGGFERFELLRELEGRLQSFPRSDYIELLHRIHRRMPREVAGISATGLPYFWHHVLAEMIDKVNAEPPESGFRLFRLPQGGFLVRSREASFAIDPVGAEIEHLLWDAIDFVILTQPLDMTRRNDQLLVRMSSANPPRPVFSHFAFHLPTVLAQEIRLSVPGTTYEVYNLRVTPLGRPTPDGRVPPAISYQVQWPDGTVLVIAEPIFLEEFAPRGTTIDALILSARHPRARIVGQRLRAKLTVLDDLLAPSIMSGPQGRIRLADGFALQRNLLPHRSVLLAPGESVDINGG